MLLFQLSQSVSPAKGRGKKIAKSTLFIPIFVLDPEVFAILCFCSNLHCSEEDRDKPGMTGEYTEENDRRFHLHMLKLHSEAQEHNSKIVSS